jgi:hypothetical protein
MRITASPSARVSWSVIAVDGIQLLPQPYTRPAAFAAFDELDAGIFECAADTGKRTATCLVPASFEIAYCLECNLCRLGQLALRPV